MADEVSLTVVHPDNAAESLHATVRWGSEGGEDEGVDEYEAAVGKTSMSYNRTEGRGE